MIGGKETLAFRETRPSIRRTRIIVKGARKVDAKKEKCERIERKIIGFPGGGGGVVIIVVERKESGREGSFETESNKLNEAKGRKMKREDIVAIRNYTRLPFHLSFDRSIIELVPSCCTQ